MPKPKLTIAQNGWLWREVSSEPSLPVICQINTGRESVRERVKAEKSDLSPYSQRLRFLALSVTVMWAECQHFFCGVHTVRLLFTRVWDGQSRSYKSWQISEEEAGLQSRGEVPVHTWWQRLVLCLLNICTGIHFTLGFHKHGILHKQKETKVKKKQKTLRQGCVQNTSHQP